MLVQPSSHLPFLAFEQSSRHPASQPQVYGTALEFEHVAAALAQERSVGRGANGWCLGSRKAVCAEMETCIL